MATWLQISQAIYICILHCIEERVDLKAFNKYPGPLCELCI